MYRRTWWAAKPATLRAREWHRGPGCRGHQLAAGGRLQAVDEVRRALRVAGRGEDRAAVCFEHVQPVGDVGGVVLTRLKRQIKIGTEERGAKFGHEFFDRVTFGAETFGAEVARQARFVCGPVGRLVREGGVVAFGVAERLKEWQHNAVSRGPIKGTVATVGER